jgi:hypothetical protein
VIERGSSHEGFTAQVPLVANRPTTTNDQRLVDRLAALAGLPAVVAALAGLVPGVYRDPEQHRMPEKSATTQAGNQH